MPKTLGVFQLLVLLYFVFSVFYISGWRTFGSFGLAGRVGVCGSALLAVGLLRVGSVGGRRWPCWRAGGRAWRVGSGVGLGLAGVPALPIWLQDA